MPNPNLLRVHFIIAKILEETGLERRIYEALDYCKWGEYDEIAADGSTDLGHVLSFLMLTDI